MNTTDLSSNSRPLLFLCCGDALLINFSVMEFYPQFLPESQITWSDSNLWQLLFLILIALPAWILICSLFLQKKKLANTQLGDTITALTTAVFLILSFIRFMTLLEYQPHWNFLQSNIFIGIGYFIIFIGFCHLQQAMKSLGILQIFKANSVPKSALVKQNVFRTCTSSFGVESTLYFGNSLLHLGASLIYASQAGMLITFALGFSYIEITFIRKNLGIKVF
ncbi:unnamed protein product [Acanthosepion pharaonis]|uniref:Uncharacterized protein n=1 Tax=Acanthosepion pharaonis TaxID=158019 RepID=A0A812CN60_ACAPH|nr:unnamed protein product [Sepia pharaonis]